MPRILNIDPRMTWILDGSRIYEDGDTTLSASVIIDILTIASVAYNRVIEFWSMGCSVKTSVGSDTDFRMRMEVISGLVTIPVMTLGIGNDGSPGAMTCTIPVPIFLQANDSLRVRAYLAITSGSIRVYSAVGLFDPR
jgi:hypothetical protein